MRLVRRLWGKIDLFVGRHPWPVFAFLVVLAAVVIFWVLWVLDLPQEGSPAGGMMRVNDMADDVARILEIMEKWDAISAEGLGSGNLAPE